MKRMHSHTILPLNRVTLFLLYFMTTAVALIVGFATHFHLAMQPDAEHQTFLLTVLPALLVFERHAVDLLIIGGIGSLLINGGKLLRTFASIAASLYLTANTIQLAAYIAGGEFLSALALENSRHISLLINPKVFLGLILWLAFLAILPILASRQRPVRWRHATTTAVTLVALGGSLRLVTPSLPADILNARQALYSKNNLTKYSPLAALVGTLLGKESINYNANLTPIDQKIATSIGIEVNPTQPFPLRKEWIYKSPAPFPTTVNPPAKSNIIVLFTEGFSARALSIYGSPLEKLTPNITRFAQHPATMVVDNYFSHTAATYRGLHGQLCSLFPKAGGGDDGWDGTPERTQQNNYYCLSHYLNQHGYRTLFLDAHRRDAARVDELARLIEFQSVLTAEDLSPRYLGNAEPTRSDALSDQQFLKSLTGLTSDPTFLREGKMLLYRTLQSRNSRLSRFGARCSPL